MIRSPKLFLLLPSGNKFPHQDQCVNWRNSNPPSAAVLAGGTAGAAPAASVSHPANPKKHAFHARMAPGQTNESVDDASKQAQKKKGTGGKRKHDKAEASTRVSKRSNKGRKKG